MTLFTSNVVFFSDVDGVVHGRHFEKNGDKIERYPDENLHFDMNASFWFVEDGYKFYWSEEMVDWIYSLISSGAVDFKWLTKWKQHAVNKLNPIFGFPEYVTYLDWHAPKSDVNHDGKGVALLELYKNLAEDERTPFIWVDDIATRNYIPGSKYENVFKELKVPHLIIQTDYRYGITKENQRDINEFIRRYS